MNQRSTQNQYSGAEAVVKGILRETAPQHQQVLQCAHASHARCRTDYRSPDAHAARQQVIAFAPACASTHDDRRRYPPPDEMPIRQSRRRASRYARLLRDAAHASVKKAALA